MVGTIMGVMKGEKWIRDQGWVIKDEYRNDRRPGLPRDLTITDFAAMHHQLAERVILENGGEKIEIDGHPGFRIKTEEPGNIETLPVPLHRAEELRNKWRPIIREDISGDSLQQARAVYLAICLDMVQETSTGQAEVWFEALESFSPYFESLFGDGMWSPEARAYFEDVTVHENLDPESPLLYP